MMTSTYDENNFDNYNVLDSSSNVGLDYLSTKSCVIGVHKDVKGISIFNFYTSIVEGYNICPTTDVTDVENINPAKFTEWMYKDRSGKVETVKISKEPGIIPSVFKSLFDLLDFTRHKCGKNSKTGDINFILDTRVSIKKEIYSIYSRLPKRLRCLVESIGAQIILKIKEQIEDKGGIVIYSSTDDILWTGIEKFDVNFPFLRYEFNIEPFNMVIYSQCNTSAYNLEGKLLREFTFRAKNYPIVNEITDLISRKACLNDYSVDDFLLDFYQICSDMISGMKDNSLYTKRSKLMSDYTCETYMMNIYTRYLVDVKGIELKAGDIVEYQVVKSDNKHATIGSKMRLPSIENDIDYDYYIDRFRFFDHLFKIESWKTSKSSPVTIMKRLINNGSFPSFEDFSSSVKEHMYPNTTR